MDGDQPARIGRRAAIVGAAASAAAGLAGLTMLTRRDRPSDAGDRSVPPSTSLASGAPARAPAVAAAPTVARIDTAATSSQPADRPYPPLRIDWIGGSDVLWDGVSLPDSFQRRVLSVERRPLIVNARTRQALMPAGARELMLEAIADRTDAILVSMNLVWLHWDERSCAQLDPYERYGCLLTRRSEAVDRERAQDMQALVQAAVDSGVPAYLYTQPHSSEVLADPSLSGLIAEAETAMTTYDPRVASVKFVGQTITRSTPPMREGAEFKDFVHPAAAGAEVIADWLATDVTAFWTAAGLGR